METVLCQIPGGYIDHSGAAYRDVELAPLTGSDEELIAARYATRPGPTLTSELLARRIQRIGLIDDITPGLTRALLVADRQYLLIKLFEASFGPTVSAVVHCPAPGCGQVFDLDFQLSELPCTIAPVARQWHTVELAGSSEDAAASWTLALRLPNGSDQEALAHLVGAAEVEVRKKLLARCIDPQCRTLIADLDQWLTPERCRVLQTFIGAHAPRMDLTMEGLCPLCATPFISPFDPEAFFFETVQAQCRRLRQEVHFLAYHYHWSEREILAMDREKRQSYITILADALERARHG